MDRAGYRCRKQRRDRLKIVQVEIEEELQSSRDRCVSMIIIRLQSEGIECIEAPQSCTFLIDMDVLEALRAFLFPNPPAHFSACQPVATRLRPSFVSAVPVQ